MSKVSKNCGISGKNLWKNGGQGAEIVSLGRRYRRKINKVDRIDRGAKA